MKFVYDFSFNHESFYSNLSWSAQIWDSDISIFSNVSCNKTHGFCFIYRLEQLAPNILINLIKFLYFIEFETKNLCNNTQSKSFGMLSKHLLIYFVPSFFRLRSRKPDSPSCYCKCQKILANLFEKRLWHTI